jgi:phosphatidylserine/phosphatidylglycerophosphate/cardiolipin synthase-like enzyme
VVRSVTRWPRPVVSGLRLLEDTDRVLGDGIGAAVRDHHRRRLARIGWQEALIDGKDGPRTLGPLRPGNRVDVLVDGEQAFAEMVDALRSATSHVALTGWFVSPDFVLRRDGDTPVVLRNLLAELAERIDVRVLLWAGAPLPLFHPSRHDVRRVRRELCEGSRIACALDSHERPLHCHHEKLLVVDDRIAFVGGIDPTTMAGDRLDSPRHLSRAAVGWHDAAARIEGPVVAEVARHFAMRWREVTRESLPEPAPQPEVGPSAVRILRTVPERVYRSQPTGEFSILAAYVRLLRSARRLIYLESQYLWSAEIGSVLAEKLKDPPSERFRIVIVLPAKPYGGGDDTRGVLGELIAADGGADRILACTLFARCGELADPIYVHAKVGIVDDRVLTLGSANLNDHSMFNDTEVNLLVEDEQLARATRLRLWSEHLECDPAEIDGDPTDVIDQRWRPIAADQLERRRAGLPLSHRLVLLPDVSRRSARLLGPLQGLIVDG